MLAEEDLTGPSSFTSVYDWLIIKIYIYIYKIWPLIESNEVE